MTRQNIKQELKEKDYFINLLKECEAFNLGRTSLGGKTKGHEKLLVLVKKAQAYKQRYGSYDPIQCSYCDKPLPLTHYTFDRDTQESGGSLICISPWNGKKAGVEYKLKQNPRSYDFNEDCPPMIEWDHPNPADKTVENSVIWKSYSYERAYPLFMKTQPLCVSCHRNKNARENKAKKNQKRGILFYDDFIDLLKTEVKPYSKYHYIPPKEGAKKSNIKKYGKGALAEAIEKAEKNKDTALVEDLKRMSRRPDLDYKEYKFKWSEFTGNESTHEINKRNINKDGKKELE